MGEYTKENIVDVTIYPRLRTNDELKNLFLEKVGTKFILKKETSSGKPHIVIYRPQARLFDDLTEEFNSFFEKHEKSLLVVLGEDVSKYHLDQLEKRFKCSTFSLQTSLRKMKKGSCDKKTWNDLWTKMHTLYGNVIQRRRSIMMQLIAGRQTKKDGDAADNAEGAKDITGSTKTQEVATSVSPPHQNETETLSNGGDAATGAKSTKDFTDSTHTQDNKQNETETLSNGGNAATYTEGNTQTQEPTTNESLTHKTQESPDVVTGRTCTVLFIIWAVCMAFSEMG